ncbi:class F sortase [Conexibacter arvalis]|uniref:Sortase family protein n=1 Tax=Conexibacter arvalis TaxID=912552 RepID=A0A840IN61_9ACTN|nr:class F sortase [Conexibacter arvalis]MBB4665290.1 hypothetical protein [Conexibacter arvalis]
MRRFSLVFTLATLAVLLAPLGATPASAAEPPNQNDPCSQAGRNTCRTTGFGAYRTYRYGIRWFGSYRNAIPNVALPAWCIDLRFWYPSSRFGYKKRPIAGLRSKEGKRISAAELRRMSWVIFNHGSKRDNATQAAVMLYVHSVMDDGAPGEVDPAAVGVSPLFNRISRDARRYAGPYKVTVDAPAKATAGTKFTAVAKVRSATGVAMPNVRLRLAGSRGADGRPRVVRTNSRGEAKISGTAADVDGGVRLKVETARLAAPAPDLYVPTKGAAVRNAQRLVVAASTTVSAQATTRVEPAKVTVTTAATPTTLLLGEANSDKITISGPPSSWRGKVTVRAYGPAASGDEIRCEGQPTAEVSYTAGPGESQAPPVTPTAPGWYGYQVIVEGSSQVVGVTTPCAEPSERFVVEVQPAIRTQINEQSSQPGATLTDRVWVSGLHGQPATVGAALYGPFPARDALTCDGAPFWQGSYPVSGDGEFLTDPVTVTVPGYYTYRETIAASGFVRAASHPCGEEVETTVVRGTPAIRTEVSQQQATVGAEISDTVFVSGLGRLRAPVEAELWGPYPSREAMTCEGTPAWKGTLTVEGDGTYVTDRVKIKQAGWYTYRERILATEAFDGVETACGEESETTIVRAAPKVVTKVSSRVVRPGSRIFDRLVVSGLGETTAKVEVELHGPFRTRAAITCSRTPFWKGAVTVKGDGSYVTPKVLLRKSGFYAYRERIASSPVNVGTETACAEEAETSLVQPLIPTGGEPRQPLEVDATKAPRGGSRPTSIRLARLGAQATLRAVSIDSDHKNLHVPNDIRTAGWWADGSSPGAKTGTTLIAGHVDSARRGAGAFYPLSRARRGDAIELRTADGKTRRYRVTRVQRVRKDRLPSSIFSRQGSPRLALVTCGGPFANGHYRDNVIVFAVPR